ncbi:MAG: HAD-IIB family hydrolase [Myxococcota bacterium]
MRFIDEFPRAAAARLRGVFADIDGTLTRGGKITADAYLAMWRLQAAGLAVVPVTGRPAGWCDMIARQWPVDGVIGENGALAFYETNGELRRLYHPATTGDDLRCKLDAIRDDVLRDVPGSRVAKDQSYRLFDLAIDVCEEEPDLGLDAAEAIRAVFERHGAKAKISSIHVNGWFGDYDKLSMVRIFCSEVWDLDIEAARDEYIFCGDSPNDEAMFEFFPNACAVANIAPFKDRMTHLPRYVAAREGGDGFAEIVDLILALRQSNT